MNSYIKLPALKPLPDSSIEKRKLSDDIWFNYIFYIILKYYRDVDRSEIFGLINDELSKERSQIEKVLNQLAQ